MRAITDCDIATISNSIVCGNKVLECRRAEFKEGDHCSIDEYGVMLTMDNRNRHVLFGFNMADDDYPVINEAHYLGANYNDALVTFNLYGTNINGLNIRKCRFVKLKKEGGGIDEKKYGIMLVTDGDGQYAVCGFSLSDGNSNPKIGTEYYRGASERKALNTFECCDCELAPLLNPKYWNCKCDRFIQEWRTPFCPLCNAKRDNMPLSRQDEIDTGGYFAPKLFPKYHYATLRTVAERLIKFNKPIKFALNLKDHISISKEVGIIGSYLENWVTAMVEPANFRIPARLILGFPSTPGKGEFFWNFQPLKSVDVESLETAILKGIKKELKKGTEWDLYVTLTAYLTQYEMEITIRSEDDHACVPITTIATDKCMETLKNSLNQVICKTLEMHSATVGEYRIDTVILLDGERLGESEGKCYCDPNTGDVEWEGTK